MSAFISQTFYVSTEGYDDVEIFVNKEGNEWVGAENMSFSFTITKEEWELLKDFLDNQFKSIKNG